MKGRRPAWQTRPLIMFTKTAFTFRPTSGAPAGGWRSYPLAPGHLLHRTFRAGGKEKGSWWECSCGWHFYSRFTNNRPAYEHRAAIQGGDGTMDNLKELKEAPRGKGGRGYATDDQIMSAAQLPEAPNVRGEQYRPGSLPPVEAWLEECKLKVYQGADKTWHWTVLTPPDWPWDAEGSRRPLPFRDRPSGRNWYSGSCGVLAGEVVARTAACLQLGRCVGLQLAAWMGPQVIPSRELPGLGWLGYGITASKRRGRL